MNNYDFYTTVRKIIIQNSIDDEILIFDFNNHDDKNIIYCKKTCGVYNLRRYIIDVLTDSNYIYNMINKYGLEDEFISFIKKYTHDFAQGYIDDLYDIVFDIDKEYEAKIKNNKCEYVYNSINTNKYDSLLEKSAQTKQELDIKAKELQLYINNILLEHDLLNNSKILNICPVYNSKNSLIEVRFFYIPNKNLTIKDIRGLYHNIVLLGLESEFIDCFVENIIRYNNYNTEFKNFNIRYELFKKKIKNILDVLVWNKFKQTKEK